MNTTAFIHASVAYPNCVGQPSLILKEDHGEPFLVKIIQAYLDTPEVNQVVVIISDEPADERIEGIIKTNFTTAVKPVITHAVSSTSTYSFKRRKETLRDIHFPYLWRSTWGLFTLEGFKKLTAQFNATNVILMEADHCILISSSCIESISQAINDQLVRYVYSNPFRELIGANVSFIHTLIQKYKNKIQNTIIAQGQEPIMGDLFNCIHADENKTYIAKESTHYKSVCIPLLREQEYALLRCMRNQIWNDYEKQFEAIRNYLSPFMPEYLELELVNYCNKSCSFCPLSKISSKNNKLPVETVKNIIADFAKTGSIVNFSGFGEPLLDDGIVEYVRFAKENNIISVWLETNGTLLDEKRIGELIDNGLDLLLINANVYSDEKEQLERLIELITDQKKKRESLFPLVALTYVVTSWLTKEYDNFLRPFEGTVDRLILRSPRDYEEIELRNKAINFSPLNRSSCRKIVNSIYIKADGKTGICDQDLSGGIIFQEATKHSAIELLNTSIQTNIIKEQNNNFFGKTFNKCSACREWYVPSLGQSFFDIDLSLLVNGESEQCSMHERTYTFDELTKHEERLRAIIATCDDTLNKCNILLSSFLVGMHDQKDVVSRTMLDKQMMFLCQRIRNMELLKFKFCSYFMQLGDVYVQRGEYEKGLTLWERVLKVDPSNKHIHKRLNALLKEAQVK
ncbi:MAG: radical SAM protein [Candidatus Omnitrophica bacterium]|nr:radical SAM protein [Candidatus Omnitrophota bacterium]